MFTRSLLFAKRTRGRTLLLFLVFFLFFCFCFSSIVLLCSAEKTKASIMKQIGSYLQFEPNHMLLTEENPQMLEPHDQSVIQRIRSMEHVLGFDPFNYETFVFCSPIGFQNSKKHTGENPNNKKKLGDDLNDEVMSQGITLFGLPDILVRDEFRRGFSHLVQGTIPTDENPGLLVNNELMMENNLKLGDSIELRSIDENKTQRKAKIIGVFETDLKFEILPANILGNAVYAYSPYNRIYTNYAFVSEMAQRTPSLGLMRIYLDSPENSKTVQEQISRLPINWDQYVLVNGTETYYEMVSSSLIQVFEGSRKILYGSIFSLFIIAVVFSVLWNQNESYEVSVLLLLGEKKKIILLERILRHTIIAAIAYVAALPTGYLLLRLVILNTPLFSSMQSSLQSSGSFYTGEFAIHQSFQLALPVKVFLLLTVFAIVVVVIFNVRATRLVYSKQAGEVIALTQEE